MTGSSRFLSLLLWLLVSTVANAASANPFVINEVVASPRQDHNDATPFDGTPGAGAATDLDEYIELKNVTMTAQSLENFYLEMADTTPSFDCFTFNAVTPLGGTCADAGYYMVHDAGGNAIGGTQNELRAVPAGGYVVIGDPDGVMSSVITVTLVDDSTATVDTTSPIYSSGWAGSESSSRFPDGADTGDDALDFAPVFGTPGASNGAPCTLVAAMVVNEVVSDPQQDWDADTGGVPFDGSAGAGTIGNGDEYVELHNASGSAVDLTTCILELSDTSRERVVFTDVDAPLAPYVRVFDDTGTQVGTATALTAVPAGGYVLIGDPPGTMNLSQLTVSVLTDAGPLDQAMLELSADSLIDESRARFPNGADTDVDPTDFAPLAASPGRSNGELCAIAAGGAVVNEVVTDPQQDWSNELAGTPFDGTFGAGTVNTNDEYIELANTSGAVADLTGCVLSMTDGTDTKIVLQPLDAVADPFVRVFDDTGTQVGTAPALESVPIGGYVLIGDPPGSLLNDSTVALLHDAGTLDSVTVDANAGGLLDQAAARFPDGTDTDIDADDLTQLRSTPGASNGTTCPIAVGDAVINEVIGDPQQDWDHDDAATAFNGTAAAGTVGSDDELVELANTSGAEADFRGCTLQLTDTTAAELVLQPLDATLDPYVRVFDATGTMVGTATSLGVVPAGGYVVIGNPPGTLNNDAIVTLLSDAVLDTVDFGNDADDLNASDTSDEAAARLPNGADTDVGADDFRAQPATVGANNELDECALGVDDCDAIASCTDTAAGFDCTCPAGYLGTGQICTDANECQAGSHNCDDNAACTNTDGSFTCACNAGFSGDGLSCADIDECAGGNPGCDDNADCVNLPGTFNCVCVTGFEGDGDTCTDVNECSNGDADCGENAFCTNTPGSFECACDAGFEGDGRTCTPGSSTEDGGDDNPTTDEGCGCEVAGRSGRGSPGAGLLLLSLLGWAARRRKRFRILRHIA